jgi:hypothetical protein
VRCPECLVGELMPIATGCQRYKCDRCGEYIVLAVGPRSVPR